MNRRIFLGASISAAMIGPAYAASRQKLLLGTSPPGGGFTPFGDAFARTVNQHQTLALVDPVFTKGSLENIPMLEAGRLGLGLAGGEATFEALSGQLRTPAPLRVIAPMYSSAGMFAVPATSRVRSIEDLRGKPVVFGAPGSSLVVQARYILKGMGLNLDRDFKAILLSRDDLALAMLRDGRAAALWGGGVAWPAFHDIAKTSMGARFIVPTPAQCAEIVRRLPFLKRLSVRAGTYQGQSRPIESVGSWSVVLGRADMPDALAYALAKAVNRGEAGMARRVASGSETISANTWLAASKPEYIHPGVRRFLADAGIARA